jgi:hypothetical protein
VNVNVNNAAALAAANAQALAPALGFGTPVSFSLEGPAGPTTYVVPVTQRLVIEYLSGQCIPIEGAYFFPSISVVTNGVQIVHFYDFPIPPVSLNTSPLTVSFGHLVKLYAQQGSSVVITGAVGCRLSFSGQLVSP